MLKHFAVSYHGTVDVYANSILEKIDLNKSRYFTDFGKGFYLTNNYEQALEWAFQKYKDNMHQYSRVKPAIVRVELNIDLLEKYMRLGQGKIFDLPNDNWGEFVYNCRKEGRNNNIFHSKSFVCGPLADGKIVPLIKLREKGKITKQKFTNMIQPREIKQNQLSLHTDFILESILKKEVEEIARIRKL